MNRLKQGDVHIHIIRPQNVSDDQVIGCLSADEKKRAEGFRFPEHAARWSRYRAALRIILSQYLQCPPREIHFLMGAFGKPLLEGEVIDFNLSHDATLGLLALSMGCPVGIDIEHKARGHDLIGCEKTFCHPTELSKLPNETVARKAELLKIWTSKEAFLKALGTGLSIAPEKICLIGQSIKGLDGELTPIISLEHPTLVNHQAQLCTLREIHSLTIFDAQQMRNSTIIGYR